ncbi:2'-5'-oligoadenylate synthase 3-like [Candoia aspera]|uniref:2'-5'-oligoadenylate synthase 3-like n=1 Tax=Candoia aspera TaxID=51853 RepID=UPI002FD7FC8E
MEALCDVWARRLDAFHAEHLQPDREFLAKARRAVHLICGFLRERCFQEAPGGRAKVRKVVVGGSLGKGTTMKQGSDVDLVLFLDVLRSYTDQERERKRIIELIESKLTECQKELNLEVSFEKSKWPNPRVLQFRLHSNESEDYIDVDVLPALDTLGSQASVSGGVDAQSRLTLRHIAGRVVVKGAKGRRTDGRVPKEGCECPVGTVLASPVSLQSQQKMQEGPFPRPPQEPSCCQYDRSRPSAQMYVDLISTGQHGQFSPCFTELQKNFVVDRPTKLKNLIRLVKYWYKELPEQKSVPPKYALELLTVYAWEQGSRQDCFSMAEGFRTVLWLIERHTQICIYWTNYYGFENEIIKQHLHAQLSKQRPVILDPADPTANIGEGKRWDLLAKEATYSASLRCCQNPDGSLVKPWVVPVSPPGKRGAGQFCFPAMLRPPDAGKPGGPYKRRRTAPAQPVLLLGGAGRLEGPAAGDAFQALQLTVKLLTGELHSVTSSACATVWDFKIRVRHTTAVPPYQQKLACQKTHLELRDTAQLSEYGLQTGDTLLLIVKNEESIPIFLRNPNSRTSTYHVLPSDAVLQFRARIQQQENAQEFWLSYEGQTLEDGRKLCDYNIAPHGTVFLNPRLRGGAPSLCG